MKCRVRAASQWPQLEAKQLIPIKLDRRHTRQAEVINATMKDVDSYRFHFHLSHRKRKAHNEVELAIKDCC